MKLCILDDFHDCKKLFFSTFLTKVSNGLYGTSNVGSFPSPTISKAAFLILVSTYRSANLEYEAGGVDEKPAYELALTAVTDGLDSGKKYVEALPNLTLDLINLSGFTPNKQSVSSSVIPGKPVFHELVHLGAGSISIEFVSPDPTEFYGLYIVEGNEWPVGTVFSNGLIDFPKNANARLLHNGLKQRVKKINNLTIGQEYTAFAYAGNAAGISTLGVGTTFIASNK